MLPSKKSAALSDREADLAFPIAGWCADRIGKRNRQKRYEKCQLGCVDQMGQVLIQTEVDVA
jgi:hypothetical protein